MVTLDQAGSARAALSIIAPSAPLAGVVEHVWVEEQERVPAGGSRAWRIVPDDAPHVLWHRYARHGIVRHRLLLVGARSVFADIDTSDRLATVGVRLRPGAVPALFGLPASDLTDRAVALDDVVGRAAHDLAERLLESPPQLAARQLEDHLLHRLARGRAVSARATALTRLTAAGAVRVGTLADALGISSRTLRLVARAEIGLSARDAVRIRRLHRALHLGLASRRGWARAAADAGYVDQAHLTRECRALLGETPGAFAARAGGCFRL